MSDTALFLNDQFLARARRVPRIASVLVILVGLLALTGWLFDVATLKTLYADITMKANTAVSLLISGISLWLLRSSPRNPWSRRSGQTCAVLVGAIGITTLSQQMFGWNLGIDQLLFTEDAGAPATTSPGRMGTPASVCFALAGMSLLLLHARRLPSIAQSAATAVGLLALLAITGYAYGAQVLYGIAGYTGIALNTAIALLVLSVGLLASSVDRGFASVIAGEGAGSVMARRLLLLAIAVPLLLGWFRIWLESAGYFDGRFGIAVLTLSTTVILAAVIARTAVMLNRVERQKLVAEATVRERLHEIITARRAAGKEREELLARERQARADAEAANRAKDEFLATVSHELRAPLNAITGWASLLRDAETLDESVKQRGLLTIEQNCRAQAQLIEDLLDTSRIIAGNLRLEVKQVDIAEVINAAIDAVRPAAEAKRIQLRTALDARVKQVRGDPARLQQVAWNLLSNAVKFSDEDGYVEVRLSRGTSHVTITITDAGEGIDPVFLPFVFDRFRQADNRKSRRYGGMGLGLSIARHLVEMHGGTVEAESAGVGKGASFSVQLPLLLVDTVVPPAGLRV